MITTVWKVVTNERDTGISITAREFVVTSQIFSKNGGSL